MNLRKFYSETIRNGGASYNINTGELNPKKGYFVSLPQYTKTIHFGNLGEENIKNFVNLNSAVLSDDNKFVGSWVDGDMIVHLDVSEQVFDKAIAIRLAMRRNQLAIWDAENKVNIELPTNQTHGTETQRESYITSVVNRLCYFS